MQVLVTFAVVAGLARCDEVARVVCSAVGAGDDVVYLCGFGSAVSADVGVAFEYA